MRGLVIKIIIVLVVCLSATTAYADKTTWNREAAQKALFDGDAAYKAEDFTTAIRVWKHGYIQSPNVAFLYNIGQAYRKVGDCNRALYFYRRFVYLTTNSNPSREPVRKYIEENTASCQQTEDSAPRWRKLQEAWLAEANGNCENAISNYQDYMKDGADSIRRAEATESSAALIARSATQGTKESAETKALLQKAERLMDTGQCEAASSAFTEYLRKDDALYKADANESLSELRNECAPPPVANQEGFGAIVVTLIGGGAFPLIDKVTVNPPVVLTGGLFAGYPINVRSGYVDIGVGVTYQGIGYDDSVAHFTSALLNFGYTHAMSEKVSLRGDIGVGLQLMGGLVMGNPFTVDPTTEPGVLIMGHSRIAGSVEYSLSPKGFVASVGLAYGVSLGHSDLRSANIHRVDGFLGIGLRR